MLRVGFFLSALALASCRILPKNHIESKSPNGECPATNGVYPVLLGDTEDCTVFYECDWGVPIMQHCPTGTSWSSMHRCDDSEVDQCPNAQSNLFRSAVGKCPNPSGEFPVYLPDDEDCSIFYECSNGIPIELQCAPGDLFDAPSGKCVKASDAQCQGSKKIAPVKISKTIQPYSPVGECPESNGQYPVYLPDSKNCSVFYECDWGRPIQLECASGDLFDAPSGKCVMAADARCQGKASRSAVGECPNPSGEFPVYLPDDEDCSIFYECSNGIPMELQCAPGDLFDAPSGKCVKASDAQCQNSKKIAPVKTAQPYSVVGECPELNGQYPVYLPDSDDCSVFYECDWGRPIKLECPLGDLFDVPTRKCVMAADATCQNSSAKTPNYYQ